MLNRVGIGLLLLLATACSEPPPAGSQLQLYRFGSVFEFNFRDLPPAAAEQLLQQIERRLDQMEQQFHPWRPSELTQTNQRLQRQQPFDSSPAMIELIRISARLYQQTDGLFNPALGQLSALWGFQHEDPHEPRTAPVDSAIQAWLAHRPSPNDIQIDGNRLQGHNASLQLDFNGFADGYALNLLRDLLRQHGVQNALLNATGDVLALGSAQGRPWQVGIRDPFAPGALAKVALHDGEALFTSGTYEKGFDDKQRHYHHILDPRTGYPSQDLVSVTVISTEPVDGDAAATALVVAGRKDWYRIARQMRLKAVMLIDQNHRILVSQDMAQRIQWLRPPIAEVELGPALTSDLQQP